jgi:citronellol/citronellal dehydrogenase
MPKPEERRILAPDLFEGQTALVTGGGTGLGRAIARVLAEAGADLLLAAPRTELLDRSAAEIRASTGRRVETAFVNVRDRESVEALGRTARERCGRIDVLVNDAAGHPTQRARGVRPQGGQAVVETSLGGTWNMTQVFGSQMLDAEGGSIVQIVAVVGRGLPGVAHAAAARAGVLELTRTLAIEWGPRVRLNCVAPGPVHTAGFETAYDPVVLRFLEGVPIPRPGTPREVADAVAFLASPAASSVTGEVLYVAGGQQIYGRNQALFDERPGRERA